MSFFSDLVMKLLRWFYELSQKDLTSQDAQKDDKLKQNLLARIDAHERGLLVESDLRAERAASAPSRIDKSPSVGFRLKRPESKITKQDNNS
jgi:hypothetical protein